MNKNILFFLAHILLLCACAPATLEPTVMPTASALPITATTLPAITEPATTQQPTATLPPTGVLVNSVRRIIWSSDSIFLAVMTDSGGYILDAQSGKVLHRLEEKGYVYPFVRDASQQHVLVGKNLWDIASGKLLYQLDTPVIYEAAFSHDGKLLAISEQNQVTLWDAQAGTRLKALDEALGDGYDALAFSADDRKLYAVSFDKIVRIADLNTGKVADLFSLPADTDHLVFIPDTTQMLVEVGKNIELWDIARAKKLFSLGSCTSYHLSAFSPDGSFVLLGPCNGVAERWNLSTGKKLEDLQLADIPTDVTAISISPDGERLALGINSPTNGSNGQMQILSLPNEHHISSLSAPSPCGSIFSDKPGTQSAPSGEKILAQGTALVCAELYNDGGNSWRSLLIPESLIDLDTGTLGITETADLWFCPAAGSDMFYAFCGIQQSWVYSAALNEPSWDDCRDIQGPFSSDSDNEPSFLCVKTNRGNIAKVKVEENTPLGSHMIAWVISFITIDSK